MIIAIAKDISKDPKAQLEALAAVLTAIEPAAQKFSRQELVRTANAFLRRLRVMGGRKA